MNVSETVTGALKGCGLVVLVIVMAVLGLGALLYWGGQPTTDPYYYPSIIAKWKKDRGNVSHFPDAIPKDAHNVRFYFIQDQFHGDYTMELSFELPAEQIESLYQDYVAKGAKFVRPNSDGSFPPGANIILPELSELSRNFSYYSPDFPNFEFTTFESDRVVALNRKAHIILYWAFST